MNFLHFCACYFMCSYVHSSETSLFVWKEMSIWDEVCHHELTEDTNYRKEVQVLDHVATGSAHILICKIVVLVTSFAKLHFM
jgi:hypothetical protein